MNTAFNFIAKRCNQWLIALVGLTILLVPNLVAQENRQADSDIKALIASLDSHRFEVRESATRQLAKLDGAAIQELAYSLVSCTPETSYRIKLALEAICTSGDEAEFYKCASILKLRFGNSDESINSKLQELKTNWEIEIRKRAIEELDELGLEVKTDDSFIAPTTRFQVVGPNVEMDVAQTKAFEPVERSKLIEQIDEVLSAGIDENRDRAFADLPLPKIGQPATRTLNGRAILLQQVQAASHFAPLHDTHGTGVFQGQQTCGRVNQENWTDI